MISRRSFLKLSGLTAVAIGAGAGTGHLFNSTPTRRFAMHGFVPDDDRVAAELLRAFIAELPTDARAIMPSVHADARWTNVLRAAFGGATHSSGPVFGGGQVIVRMSALTHQVQGDILVLDDRKSMYTPERDFNGNLAGLRRSLHGSKARYQLSAEFTEVAPLAALFAGGRIVVIENEMGVVDRISLDRNRTMTVNGPQGNTGVTISESGVYVHSSTCRHELCRGGVATNPGDLIACAPNRVMLRIEKA